MASQPCLSRWISALHPGRTGLQCHGGGGTMQAVANGVAGPEVAQRSPAPTKLWLGQRDGTALHINGHLRRVLHYPRRLTAAQMQTLTA